MQSINSGEKYEEKAEVKVEEEQQAAMELKDQPTNLETNPVITNEGPGEALKEDNKDGDKEAEDASKGNPAKGDDSNKGLTQQEIKHGRWQHTFYWVFLSLMGGLTLGIGEYFYASNYANLGLLGVGVMAPGTVCYFSVYKIILACYYYRKNGSVVNRQNSSLVYPDGRIRWFNLVPLMANVIGNAGFLAILSYAWEFAKRGGLNQGIISSFLAFAAVINIFLFRYFFNEKVTATQVLGIVIMVGCIICLGFETSGKVDEVGDASEDSEYDYSVGPSIFMSSIYALVLGSFAPWTMSLKQIFIRKYSSGYPPLDQGIDSGLLEYSLYNICTIILLQREDFAFTWEMFWIGGLAGMLICMSRTFICVAVVEGIAGPVQAL